MTKRSGPATRTKLLDAAAEIINRQGYAATSIDQILGRVGLTKGTFFYHFRTKADLARALIERFAAVDQHLLETSLERAEKLSDDPLQQLLIFVGLLLEVAEQLDGTSQPGCLFATYCYESGLFDAETNDITVAAMLRWRSAVADKLRAAAQRHPPKIDVDFESLADMLTGVFEGAFVLSRTLRGPQVFADQVRHYRNYLQLLFDA